MAWDVWEEVFKNQGWGKYPVEEVIRFVARNFYKLDRPNVKLLEVGCGPGAYVWYMAREGFDVYGIDASREGINQCRKRLDRNGLNAHLDIGDIINLPYEENMFDGVLDVGCLSANNYENTDKILEQIHRVLKPDGKFYSRTHDEQCYVGKTHDILGELEYDNISDGPFAKTGFVRLISEENISTLYGKYFNILSVDKMKITLDNQKYTVANCLITCRKEC